MESFNYDELSLENIQLISGNSHQKLASSISEVLGKPLASCLIKDFSNTEIKVDINDNIRNKDIFIIASGTYDYTKNKSINDYFMETLIIIDACRRSNPNSINLILPCFPYARQDKKEDSREPITAKLVANLLTVAGINRLLVIDLHSPQIQGFFDIPVDNLYSINLVINHLHNSLFKSLTQEDIANNFLIVSPDAGATKRTLKFAKILKLNTLIMHKQRDYSKVNCVEESIIIGDTSALNNKTAIILDDMCDTGGTMIKACENLVKHGAKDVIAVVTHGILSGKALERINNCEHLKKIIVSNTIPQDYNQSVCSKIEIFSVEELLSDAIRKLNSSGSLSDLFKVIKMGEI
jgi:ribose-phosphate pyrophosphokinase